MLPEARTAYSPGPPVDCMRHTGEHAVTVPPAPPAWYVTDVPRAMLSPPAPPLALQLKFGEVPKVVAPPEPPLVPFPPAPAAPIETVYGPSTGERYATESAR